MDSLLRAFRSGERLEFLYFWGHTPKAPGVLGKECLSQWFPSPFVVDGLLFPTAEHYMMFKKAMLFDDESVAEQIFRASSPSAVKALGRSVRRFEQNVWEQHRFAIVTSGSCAKFAQTPTLREFLLEPKTPCS